jgi:penicillin amidase
MPSENMIYADVDGHIGWIASGLMPKRSWSGMLPVPGDGSHEWSGFLTVDQLPQAYDPHEGWIATANNDILPRGYTTPIAYDWATPYRVERIREVLSGGSRFTVADFARLQHDDLSLLARAIVPALVDAARRQGASARPEVQLLASWNYRMSRDQGAPLLFEAWAPLLARRVASLALPPEAARLVGSRPDYRAVERWLGAGGGAAAAAARDSALLGALDEATRELTTRFGADLTKWRWGTVHVAPFKHPLSREFDLPSPSRGGDGNTVYATAGRDFQQTAGASYREIIDLANFDNSLAINVPGQSAQPGSEHYADLLPLWGTDRYFPLVFSRAAVERETKHVLKLTP